MIYQIMHFSFYLTVVNYAIQKGLSYSGDNLVIKRWKRQLLQIVLPPKWLEINQSIILADDKLTKG